jgi:hypothetical protein
MRLKRHNVGSLEALRALHHVELHSGAFLKVTVAISLDGGEVHEDVFASVPLNESIAFGGVEPLHRSLFSIVTHIQSNSLIQCYLLPPLHLQAENKKGRGSFLAAFVNNSESFTRATNALIEYHKSVISTSITLAKDGHTGEDAARVYR